MLSSFPIDSFRSSTDLSLLLRFAISLQRQWYKLDIEHSILSGMFSMTDNPACRSHKLETILCFAQTRQKHKDGHVPTPTLASDLFDWFTICIVFMTKLNITSDRTVRPLCSSGRAGRWRRRRAARGTAGPGAAGSGARPAPPRAARAVAARTPAPGSGTGTCAPTPQPCRHPAETSPRTGRCFCRPRSRTSSCQG